MGVGRNTKIKTLNEIITVRKEIKLSNMLKSKLKNNLFYIGVIIFSLTLFIEQLCSIETNFTHLIKGFGVGIQLVGVVILFMKKGKESN